MASKEYWQNRAIQRTVDAELEGMKIMKNALPIYEQTLSNIDREIRKVYANYATKAGLDVTQLIQILEGSDKRSFINSIKSSMASLGFNVADIYDKKYIERITRLEALKQQVYWKVRASAINIENVQKKGYKKIIRDSYKAADEDMRDQLNIAGRFSTIDDRTTNKLLEERWLNGNYRSRTEKNVNKYAENVRDIIGGGILSGISEDRMRRELRARNGVAKYDAMRLIRTEVNYFHNQGQLQTFKDLGVQYYEYQAILDGLTSDICKGLNGTVELVENAVVGENYPPMHPNCRSDAVIGFRSEYLKQQEEESEEELPIPSTIDELNERWGKVEMTKDGAKSIEVKLNQGGDKALNAEAEWIGKRAKFTSDIEMQKKMRERIDTIINTMKSEGQRSQVELLKKYLDFPAPVVKENYFDSLVDWSKKYRNEEKEHGAILDRRNGNIIEQSSGTKGDIDFTQRQWNTLEGNIIVHNHPDTGDTTSFSPSDITIAVNKGAYESVVVAKEGFYRMLYGEADYSRKERANISSYIKDTYIGFTKEFKDLSTEEFNEKLWRQVSKEYGWKYSFERYKE